MNKREQDGRRRLRLIIRGAMRRIEYTGSAGNSLWIRSSVRVVWPRIEYSEQGEQRPRKQRLPQSLP